MKDAFEKLEEGVMVGHIIYEMKFADDKAVWVSTIKEIANIDDKILIVLLMAME